MTNLRRLSEVVEINPSMPRSLRAEDRDSVVPFLAMSGVSEDGTASYLERRQLGDLLQGYTYFEHGDVLLAKITPCFENGKAVHLRDLPGPMGFGSTEFHVLRAGPDVDARYLFYALWNATFRGIGERHMTGTAGQKRLPAEFLRSRHIRVPPLAEQRRIAAVLDKADAIRRKRRESLRLLDEFLRSAFLEMFGDPVRNEKGWEVVALGELCTVQLGKMLSEKARTGLNPVPYLRNANVQWRRIDLSSLLMMDFSESELAKFELRPGDLLVCEGGEVGRCAIWQGELPRCSFQKALHRLRPTDQRVRSEYLQECLFSLAQRGALVESTSQATIAHLTKARLEQVGVPVPGASLQERFAQLYEGVRRLSARQSARFFQLDNLFDTLAQRAFRGEL